MCHASPWAVLWGGCLVAGHLRALCTQCQCAGGEAVHLALQREQLLEGLETGFNGHRRVGAMLKGLEQVSIYIDKLVPCLETEDRVGSIASGEDSNSL